MTPHSADSTVQELIRRMDARMREGMAELGRLKALLDATRLQIDASREGTAAVRAAHACINPRESFYERKIVEALREAGHRLTLAPLMAKLAERGYRPHPQTVKRYIKRLVLRGIIDNRHDFQPAGYGLSCWRRDEDNQCGG